MGIKTKLLGIIAALIIIPLSVTGVTSYVKSSNLLSENMLEANKALNREMAHTIELEFDGYLSGVKSAADNKNAKNILDNNQYEILLNDLFKNYVSNYSQAFQMYMGTDDGGMRIYPDYKFDADYDPRARSWYILAESTKEAGWTEMYKDKVTGNWSISGTAPVFDKNNQFIGAIATSLDLTALSEEIGEIVVGKRGYAFILDTEGKVIAHPDSNQVGVVMSVPEIKEVLDQKSKEGLVDYQYANGDNIVSDKYAVYNYIPSLGWYVMTSMYYDEITDQTGALMKNSLIISLITLLIAFLVGYLFSRTITKPIKQIVVDMEKVSKGDMTITSKIKSKDEIGTLAKMFNDMTKNIRGLIKAAASVTEEVSISAETLAASAEQTSASSDEVSNTVDEIARGATDQAHDTEEAARITGDLDQKFEELHIKSNSISENAENVKKVNDIGMNVLNDLKSKSEENNESTNQISTSIHELDSKSKDIGGILETISSIAAQTNLLALNASIEAARAGEHGKGFAVVADEIRKLAEESSNSADQIGSIISKIQNQTEETVSIMSVFKENSVHQYKAVEEVDKQFIEISRAIQDISTQIDGINEFIGMMLDDKNKIVEAITNVSSVSQETAAASEEVSATMDQQNAAVMSIAEASERLNELSIELKDKVSKFKI